MLFLRFVSIRWSIEGGGIEVGSVTSSIYLYSDALFMLHMYFCTLLNTILVVHIDILLFT